jgi:hypothetical protein
MGIRYEASELVSLKKSEHFTTMVTAEYAPLRRNLHHESTKTCVAIPDQPAVNTTTSTEQQSHGSQKLVLEPFFPVMQSAPSRWLGRKFPQKRQQALLLIGLCLTWCLGFAILLLDNGMAPVKVHGVYQQIKQLDCTDTFWLDSHRCGIEGANCLSPDVSMAFSCPANCAGVKVQKQHLVGAEDIVGQTPVIGGPLYRADSSICAAAIHADIINDSKGGCGIVSVSGQANSFPGSASNGIESINLESYFPQTFQFQYDGGFSCQVKETKRWLLPYLSIALTVVVFAFTTSSAVPFFLAIVVGFVHVISLSESTDVAQRLRFLQTASASRSPQFLDLVQTKFLPALVCLSLVYRRSVRQTFHNLTAQFEKTVFWLGGFWIGALANHTLEWIPASSLSLLDLDTRHLLLTKFILIFITLRQLHYLSVENRLSKTLPVYTAFGLALLALTVLPVLHKFIHFYILALLLLPGSGIQTRLSLFHQGLLVGLAVQGIASNGFVITTPLQSNNSIDAALSSLLPAVELHDEPVIWRGFGGSNITFAWKDPVPAAVDGISFLLNDVERARRYFGDGAGRNTFEWSRSPQAVPDYVRFSWVKDGRAIGYGNAGVWEPHGEWSGLGGA